MMPAAVFQIDQRTVSLSESCIDPSDVWPTRPLWKEVLRVGPTGGSGVLFSENDTRKSVGVEQQFPL